ncbi:hypothetical protein B0H14DRAFT_2631367 [Mycena olivaceomarginata]|nr:hypothetical protein B0H14DRAFT_2631367 [Mycena olivaceomarginata]
MPLGSLYLPVIVPDFPSAPNLVSLDHLGCLGFSHPSTGMSNNLPFTPELQDSIHLHSRTPSALAPLPDASALFPQLQQSFAWVVPLFIHGYILSGCFPAIPSGNLITSPYLRDLLSTLETSLWLRFQMPQFLSHGFDNPPPGSFLILFMAASFAVAFLPFPPADVVRCEAFVLQHIAPRKTVTDWELGVSVTTIAILFVVFLLVDKASLRDSGTLACNPGRECPAGVRVLEVVSPVFTLRERGDHGVRKPPSAEASVQIHVIVFFSVIRQHLFMINEPVHLSIRPSEFFPFAPNIFFQPEQSLQALLRPIGKGTRPRGTDIGEEGSIDGATSTLIEQVIDIHPNIEGERGFSDAAQDILGGKDFAGKRDFVDAALDISEGRDFTAAFFALVAAKGNTNDIVLGPNLFSPSSKEQSSAAMGQDVLTMPEFDVLLTELSVVQSS